MISNNNTTNNNICYYTTDQKVMLWLDEDTFLGFNAEITGYTSGIDPQDTSEKNVSLCDSKNVKFVKVECFYTIESANENSVRLIIYENDVCLLQYIIGKNILHYYMDYIKVGKKKGKKKQRYAEYKFHFGDSIRISLDLDEEDDDDKKEFCIEINDSYKIYMSEPKFLELYYCLTHSDMRMLCDNLLLNEFGNDRKANILN